jgi:hypothetical protein
MFAWLKFSRRASKVCSGSIALRQHSIAALCDASNWLASIPSNSSFGSTPLMKHKIPKSIFWRCSASILLGYPGTCSKGRKAEVIGAVRSWFLVGAGSAQIDTGVHSRIVSSTVGSLARLMLASPVSSTRLLAGVSFERDTRQNMAVQVGKLSKVRQTVLGV